MIWESRGNLKLGLLWRRRRTWIEEDMKVGASGQLRVNCIEAREYDTLWISSYGFSKFQILNFLCEAFRLNII